MAKHDENRFVIAWQRTRWLPLGALALCVSPLVLATDNYYGDSRSGTAGSNSFACGVSNEASGSSNDASSGARINSASAAIAIRNSVKVDTGANDSVESGSTVNADVTF